MEDLEIATQLGSVVSCTAQRSTISTLCDFFKHDVNKEQSHGKLHKFLTSNDLNSLILKLF